MERDRLNSSLDLKSRYYKTDENGMREVSSIIFNDPFRISQPAWREIIRYQVFSQSPSNIAYTDRDGATKVLSSELIEDASTLESKKRRQFLDHWSFELFEAREVIIAKIV